MTAPKLDRLDGWGMVVGVLLAVGAYAGSAGHQFVYDDISIIVARPELHSLANWREILTASWWPNALYRPVTLFSFAVDWSLSNGNPNLFHGINIFLHALTTALVYLLARGWLSGFGAATAAFLFAIHPVHVEAVANIVGRAEVLAALFTITAALLYRWDGTLASAGDRSWRRWVASFGCLGALGFGLASKEIAFAIPGVLLIGDWLDAKYHNQSFGARLQLHWILWFAALALSLEWLMFRALIVGAFVGEDAAPGLFGESLGIRVLIMAPVVQQYLRLLFFPLKLSADYSVDFLRADPTVTLRGIVGFAALAACIAIAWTARRRAPLVTFGLAWIGGTLLVIANVLVPTGVILAERSMYVPSVGAVLILAWLAHRLGERSFRAAVATVAVVTALGLARTMTRVPIWHDAEVFLPQLVEDAPGSFRGHWVAGLLAYRRGDRSKGERLLKQAIRTYPLSPNVWHDYGRHLQTEQRWREAGIVFGTSFRIDERRTADAANSIGNYLRAGLVDSAAAVASRMRAAWPDDPQALLALAEIALARGHPMEAMTWRRQAAWRYPDDVIYWYLVADAALGARYCPEVTRSVKRVRLLDPDLPELEALDELSSQAGCNQRP